MDLDWWLKLVLGFGFGFLCFSNLLQLQLFDPRTRYHRVAEGGGGGDPRGRGARLQHPGDIWTKPRGDWRHPTGQPGRDWIQAHGDPEIHTS